MAGKNDADDAPPAAPAPTGLRRLRPHHWGILGGLLVLLLGGGYYVFIFRSEVPPDKRLKVALQYLDVRRHTEARDLVKKLEEQGYKDPDFPGGVPFVLGIASFRDVLELDEQLREPVYMTAVSYLKQAASASVIAERRPEWAYALGVCLQKLGWLEEAIPLLEEAVRGHESSLFETSMLLAESYLQTTNTSGIERALELMVNLARHPNLDEEDRDRVALQQAQILIALGRKTQAEQVLETVSRTSIANQGSIVLQAQTHMLEANYTDAMRLLEPVANDEGLRRSYPAQASYLMGVCAERQGQHQNAISYFEKTIERFERTHEAVAARLGAAESMRRVGRNEEAIEQYGRVLRSIQSADRFRNRWIPLRRLKETVTDAWKQWLEAGRFAEAIDLARLMGSILPADESMDYMARASERWAEKLDREYQMTPPARRGTLQSRLMQRWAETGRAYSRLAELRTNSSAYLAALASSAECFIKAREFAKAAERLTEFIDTRDTTRLPISLVRRGEVHLELQKHDEALADFRTVLTTFPKSPNVFEAEFLVGRTLAELGKFDSAERVWRKLLDNENLAPTAIEWRNALSSLSELLYQTADLQLRQSVVKYGDTPLTNEQIEQLAPIFTRLEEAVDRFQEYLIRFPESPKQINIRLARARALQRLARLPEYKLRSAETDNARTEFRKQRLFHLDRALQEFERLETELTAMHRDQLLTSDHEPLLRIIPFDRADCLYELERYDDAITAYSNAANRHQLDAQILHAFVQIANCYDRLKRPAESLSTLAQARLILKQLPNTAFDNNPTSLNRENWQLWLDWAMKSRQARSP